jgi:hypothetical protein
MTISMSDADTSPEYSIVSNTTANSEDTTTAIELRRVAPYVVEIWLVEAADYSAGASINFAVSVTDAGQPAFSAVADVRITVAELIPLHARTSTGYVTSMPTMDDVDFNIYRFTMGRFANNWAGLVAIEHDNTAATQAIDLNAHTVFDIVQAGFLIDEMLFVDAPMLNRAAPQAVKMFAQLETTSLSAVGYPKTVRFTLTSGLLEAVQLDVDVDQSTGLCEVGLVVPDAWLSSEIAATYSLSATIVGDVVSSSRTGRVVRRSTVDTIQFKPAPEPVTFANAAAVWLVAPSSGVYEHESTRMGLHTYAPQGLKAFTVTFSATRYLRLLSFVSTDLQKWLVVLTSRKDCPSFTEGSAYCAATLTIAGKWIGSGAGAPESSNLVELLQLEVDFLPPASGEPVPTWESHAISFQFDEFTSLVGNQSPTSGVSDRTGTVSGVQFAQVHALAREQVHAVSVSVTPRVLVNTAVFTADPVIVDIHVYTHKASGGTTSTTNANEISCTGSDDQVALVALDCSTVTLLGSASKGASAFEITVVHTSGIEASTTLEIWFPEGPVVLDAAHKQVAPIADWPAADCSGRLNYQRTTVTATARFSAGANQSFVADVTDTVGTLIQNSHPEFGTLEYPASIGTPAGGGVLQYIGLQGPGVSTLSIATHGGAFDSNDVVITIGGADATVAVAGMLITVIADLQLFVPDIPSPGSEVDVTARVLRGLHAVGEPYSYTPHLVSMDGRVLPIDVANGALKYTTKNSYRYVSLNATHVERKVNAPSALQSPASLLVQFVLNTGCPDLDIPQHIAGGVLSTQLVDDQSPLVTNTFMVKLAESVTAEDRSLLTVGAYDADYWRYDPIVFSIISMNFTSLKSATGSADSTQDAMVVVVQPSSDLQSLFRIDATTGELFVVGGGVLDYERMHSATLTIAVSNLDSTAAALSAGQQVLSTLSGGASYTTGLVHITLTDVNDNAPVVPESPRARLLPSTSVGTTVHSIGGVDYDSNANGELRYSLVSENIPDLMRVVGVTGSVILQAELPKGLLLTEIEVRATDKGTPPLSANGTVTIEVYDPEYLVEIDLDMSPEAFALIRNDFAVVIGAQIGIAIHLAGDVSHKGGNTDSGGVYVQTYLVHVRDEYSGLDHAEIEAAIADVPLLTIYGGMLSGNLAGLLQSIDYKNTFGALTDPEITSFVYTSTSTTVPGNETDVVGAEDMSDAAASEDASDDIGLGVGLGAFVLIAMVSLVAAFVVQRRRHDDHNRQLKHLLDGKGGGMVGGALFSFTGGEVDPMTGINFFTEGDLPDDPTFATAEELQADFNNPLFDTDAPTHPGGFPMHMGMSMIGGGVGSGDGGLRRPSAMPLDLDVPTPEPSEASSVATLPRPNERADSRMAQSEAPVVENPTSLPEIAFVERFTSYLQQTVDDY